MSQQPSRVGFPSHLSRIAVVTGDKKTVLLRTNSMHDAAEAKANNPGNCVMVLLGTGTFEDPTRWVEAAEVGAMRRYSDAGGGKCGAFVSKRHPFGWNACQTESTHEVVARGEGQVVLHGKHCEKHATLLARSFGPLAGWTVSVEPLKVAVP